MLVRHKILIRCPIPFSITDFALPSQGLDVFATEPVTAATYGDTLFTLDNVVVLPHVGATTLEVTRDSTVTAVETAYKYCTKGDVGASTLVRELEWKDLTRRPVPSSVNGAATGSGNGHV